MSVDDPATSLVRESRAERTWFERIGPARVRVRTVGDAGECPPLLMLMGIGGNLDMWRPLVDHLPGRQVVMFDFPGTGGSSAPFLPPTMAVNAAFVRVLMGRLGLRRADVLGYSWGGILAQHLAAQHPGAVRRLVLAATAAGLGSLPGSPWVLAQLMSPKRYYSQSHFRRVAPRLYGGRYRSDPDLLHAHADDRLGRPPSPLGYLGQLAAVTGYSTFPLLWAIRARTLVLAGTDDPIIPTVNPRLMAKLIRGSTLDLVPGAGHLLLIDSPETSAERIDRFLSAP